MYLTKSDILKIPAFNLARLESLKVNFRSRIGAVLVHRNKIVSVGRNYPLKTHPILRKYDKHKTLHAEIDCMIGLDRSLSVGSTIYTYREDRNGNLKKSKPCLMCMSIMRELGIKKVFYTHDKGYSELKIGDKPNEIQKERTIKIT